MGEDGSGGQYLLLALIYAPVFIDLPHSSVIVCSYNERKRHSCPIYRKRVLPWLRGKLSVIRTAMSFTGVGRDFLKFWKAHTHIFFQGQRRKRVWKTRNGNVTKGGYDLAKFSNW